MQNFSVSGVRKYFFIFIFVMPWLFTPNILGMAAMIERELGPAAFAALGDTGEVALARAAAEGLGKIGAEELEGITEGIQKALNSSVRDALDESGFKNALQQFRNKLITVEKLEQVAKEAFQSQKTGFYDKAIQESGGRLNIYDSQLLRKGFGYSEEAIGKIGKVESNVFVSVKVQPELKGAAAEVADRSLAVDREMLAQSNRTEAVISGDEKAINAAENELQVARKEVQQNQAIDKEQVQENLKEAIDKKNNATPEEEAQANKDLDDAKQKAKEEEKRTYKQNYDAAENEYQQSQVTKDGVEAKLKKAQQDFKEGKITQKELDEWTKDYENAGKRVVG